MKPEEEGHECKEEDKETRKALLKNTKPCPKCAAMIFKTEGCSQMWCVMCHTTFDWNSMEIVNGGYVHNPHYFEWARRNGREIARAPGDVPPAAQEQCAHGLPASHQFVNMVRRKRYTNTDERLLINLYMITADMREVLRPMLRHNNDDAEREELRRKYLLDEISADVMKTELIRLERVRERKIAQQHIADLFIRQATEALRFVYNTRPSIVMCPEVMEVIELAKYCNEQFKKVAKGYNRASWYRINIERGACALTKEA